MSILFIARRARLRPRPPASRLKRTILHNYKAKAPVCITNVMRARLLWHVCTPLAILRNDGNRARTACIKSGFPPIFFWMVLASFLLEVIPHETYMQSLPRAPMRARPFRRIMASHARRVTHQGAPPPPRAKAALPRAASAHGRKAHETRRTHGEEEPDRIPWPHWHLLR